MDDILEGSTFYSFPMSSTLSLRPDCSSESREESCHPISLIASSTEKALYKCLSSITKRTFLIVIKSQTFWVRHSKALLSNSHPQSFSRWTRIVMLTLQYLQWNRTHYTVCHLLHFWTVLMIGKFFWFFYQARICFALTCLQLLELHFLG